MNNDDDFLRWLRVKQDLWRIAFLLPSRLGALAFLVAILIFIVLIVLKLAMNTHGV